MPGRLCSGKWGVELELINDLDMFNMVEKGKRGGMCQVSQRFAEANNPYMGSSYDVDAAISYITYLDANNLYGLAMSQNLPISGYKWAKLSKMT